MKRIIIALAIAISPAYSSADAYIQAPEGRVSLSALPGCGGVGDQDNLLYGMIDHNDGKPGEIICWKYQDSMIHVITREITLTFLPNEVKIEGASADPSSSYSGRSKRPARISM